MPTVTKEIVIYDLEYTTWPGALERNWSKETEIREITWIAAIRVDTDTLQETDAFDCIIRPTIHPILSDYFTDLTGLSQQRLEKEGIPFLEGFRAFRRFVNSSPTACHGWDVLVLLENFMLKDLKFRAQRVGDGAPIVPNMGNGSNRCDHSPDEAPDTITVDLYGRDINCVKDNIQAVQYEVDLDQPGCFVSPIPFSCMNIKPWFNNTEPETIGKFAGELASVFGRLNAGGNIHEPLFDVRSIRYAAAHLIQTCGAGNIFKNLKPFS